MRELVSWCLDTIGVGVVAATNLASALDAARGSDIGLVLLDLDLGREDGLEILPDLRERGHLETVPFVAFTAHDSRRGEAFARGVVSFVRRPFAGADLRAAVERHMVC